MRSNDFFSSHSRLRETLESHGHSVTEAYVLDWTPGEDYDIYLVLIDGAYLISVEINRLVPDQPPMVERIELKEYQHHLSKTKRIKLIVALDLAQSSSGNRI